MRQGVLTFTFVMVEEAILQRSRLDSKTSPGMKSSSQTNELKWNFPQAVVNIYIRWKVAPMAFLSA